MTRITLSGYYGFGNAGDEAVLSGLIQALQAQASPEELDIVALSINPAETRATHGIGARHRYKTGAVLSALARTDVLLSGGGSLLQDVTSAHGIFYYLGVVRAAQIMGKKTMFAAQGIGPLHRFQSRKLVVAVANKCGALTVRDPDSAALLQKIGVKKPVEVVADPALLLGPGEQVPTARGERFGVALRPWRGDQALAFNLAEACSQVFFESRALMIPMQPRSDRPIAEQFAHKWNQVNSARLSFSPSGSSLHNLIVNLASCRLVIGMRLHALILAAACGIPSVALAYDPKVTAFMQQSDQGDAVYDLAHPDPAYLTDLLARVWAEREARAAALRDCLPALRQAASRTAVVALELAASSNKGNQ